MSNEKKSGKGSEVAVKDNPTAVAVPDFMKKDDTTKVGANLDERDFSMPRLVLLQGLSDELQQYDGLRQGEFFHNLSEVSLGAELDIVVLYVSKRYVLWNPRWNGGGILARSDDAVHWNPPNGVFQVKAYKDRPLMVEWKTAPTVVASRLDQWGTYDPSDSNSPPAATLCYVIIVALPGHPDLGPVALMMQRTAAPVAQKLLSKLQISQAKPWGMKFRMSSFDDQRGGNSFKNYRFTANGLVNEAQFKDYERMHKEFEAAGVKLEDIKGAGDEQVSGTGSAPNTGGKF